ncbi:DEAD/DEAH box helicase [Halobacillus mangrovi]|uniref:DEAD/DEAH box helicase n=1 Tax=Halobacillus mangrovi TaxID=402384 RepID=UPI003D9626BC
MIKALRNYFSKDYSWIPLETPPHTTLQLAGKLLLKHELPFSEKEITSLVDQSALTTIPSIEKHVWGYRCRRCGNQKRDYFAEMPHSSCQKKCIYCRSCIQMGRVIECEPLYYGSPQVEWPHYHEPCSWEGTLTVHQRRASHELKQLIQKGNGEKLIWAVCGAGKTEMLFPGITEALITGKRLCLATPRTDVVRELLPRFRQAFPDVKIAGLYGTSEDKKGDASFVIATTHQLYRFARAFDLIIIDEIDAFPFHNDPSLHYAAARAAKENAALIYLTATPRKTQKKRIRSKSLPAVFIPKRFHGYPLPVPQFKLTPALHRHLKRSKLPGSILERIRHQQNSYRQLLIFLPTKQQAEKISSYLKSFSLHVAYVHAEDPLRAEKVSAFRAKEYDILVTTTILERGVTFPSVDVYVMDAGHDVFDEPALVQISGRAGRSPDDPRGDVFFFHIGKTNAMLDAKDAIIEMNRLGANS